MPITIPQLLKKKTENQRITMMTCYDATFATLLDKAGIDILFIGDSLGMVVKGETNTLSVTVDEIAYHTKAVVRASQNAHILADMPFLSYHVDIANTLLNAGTLLRAGAHSVKLEGGVNTKAHVKALVETGIPVMGHVGLTPQSVHTMGGYLVQGKTAESRQRIIDNAMAFQESGAYAVVIEGVPESLAEELTSQLTIPTIGIGAGVHCNGQVLVLHDLLGLNPSFKPRFVKQFMNGGELVLNACQQFIAEVQNGSFPAPEHTFYASSPKPTPPAFPQ